MPTKQTFIKRTEVKNLKAIKLIIATGKSRKEMYWKNQNITWNSLVSRLENTTRTSETQEEYKNMSAKEQADIKDVGGFVGGSILNGRRKAENVDKRYLLTLDADYAKIDFIEMVETLFDFECCIYSTHKHTAEKPRLRLVAPFSRAVTPDEYEAISRKVAEEIGIDMFDDTTYQAHRLMYWPSTSYNGIYDFKNIEGKLLEPDKILAKYEDWKDSSKWPTSSRTIKVRNNIIKKQEEPTTKKGIVGAFCRTYDVESAIEAFLNDVYEKCEIANRYTYTQGSSAAGLVIYENGAFAYSNHATDPASGILCNAFDLVRIHKFSELDENVLYGTPTVKLPSYIAMTELAQKDKAVKHTIFKEKEQELLEDFNANYVNDIDSEDDTWIEDLQLDKKGNVLPSINNIKIILLNDKGLKDKIAFNEFSQRIVKLGVMPWQQDDNRNNIWSDTDDSGLRNYLEIKYGVTSTKKIEDAFILTADKNKFHPVRDYLNSLNWDGKERVEKLFIEYLGADDNEYVRTVTRKALAGAVARIYEPGIKFDYALVLAGAQGEGKSEIISKLGCGYSSDTLTTIQGKEAYEQIQGFWLIELGELTALKRAEVEAIKLFISKKEDAFRQAYAHHTGRYPRQCIFIGTTNDNEFLKDKTGNRRFWPVDTDREKATKNIWKDLTQDEVDLIWAEAVEIYKKGEELYLEPEIEKLAQAEQDKHLEDNPMLGIVEDYLEMLLPDDWDEKDLSQRRDYIHGNDFGKEQKGTKRREKVCALEIWAELFQEDIKLYGNRQAREIKDILRKIEGWEPCKDSLRFGIIYGTQRGFIRKIL